MTYRKRFHYVIALIPALLVLVSGCQEDVSTTALLAPVGDDIRNQSGDATGVDDASLHQTLEAIWTNTDGVLMQVFTQTIDCRAGGVFIARPVGWPEGYDVVLTVDPGTVPLNHANLVEFVMEIPVTGPVGDANSVPYEFHPDGIRFNQPVHITMAWPEWAGISPIGGMDLWYLEQETYDNASHYRVVDRKPSELAPATALAAKAGEAPLGHYSIDHFSRWNLADGTDGDNADPDEPTKGGFQPGVLANALEGDSCWTELAVNPGTRVRVDF